MRVVVVGGGIGGLALGSGLRRAGVEVSVFERDTDVRATGGYHITLDGPAQEALRGLVAPEIVERMLASGSALRLRDPDAFWDRRGRVLGYGPELRDDPGLDIDRITLRALLAEAVGDDLHLGKVVSGVGYDGDGAPAVSFDDGSSVTGDLVVGADGAHSLVARFLAGGPTNAPAGIVGFSGRTSVADLSAGERERLGTRSGLVVGPHGAALYLGFLDPVGNAVLNRPELRASVTTGPTFIWGAMFPDSPVTDALRKPHGSALRAALVDRFLELGWSARVLEVLGAADPATVAAFRFNAASSRAGDLAPWGAGRITALGDAVHATPPTAGMGAGAAIRDAADLVERLGHSPALAPAVAAFEAAMRERGAAVLTAAMGPVRWILCTDTVAGAALTRAATPVLAAVARARGLR
ncbi:FAD-dependent monooxygenase [Nocardia asteroides]|uniref:FAD-dependent monooxygenase n=1 Tax=Nocardia asteroides TaxID=1824 RepID=UPI001E50DC7C|nr:FAD-dependent monooxygenase [Nocardia asteroides]UGT62395.1 FAD-dependent monooxygenase [Nocardia asteroides]